MIDPIGGFQSVRDLVITYMETAFRIRRPEVSAERRALLEAPGTLCTEPLLEPIPRYSGCGWRLDELATAAANDARLPGFDAGQRRAFAELALAGLFETANRQEGDLLSVRAKHQLYEHQEAMLRRGTAPGQPGIVTSGTGSGKTESFLLPVIASLARESAGWPAPKPEFFGRRWWQDQQGRPAPSRAKLGNGPTEKHPTRTPFYPQRAGETRQPAVRAIVLYPMNALVEDQLVRIRRALDSEPARRLWKERFNGNRIFFGRYIGPTPTTGFDVPPRRDPTEMAEDSRAAYVARRRRKLDDLFRDMSSLQLTQEEARRQPGDDAPGHPRYQFPSHDGAEMLSRWDMQHRPPDLLITNVTMLSAMLTREVDAPLFEATRKWLISSPDAYFYLILDELHLHRGSAGTEVACLLRLLLRRLGLTLPAHRHKLRVLASSASMPMEPEAARAASLEYLFDMFGRHGTWCGADAAPMEAGAWAHAVIPGRPINEQGRDRILTPGPYRDLLQAARAGHADPADPGALQKADGAWRAVAADLLGEIPPTLAEVVRGSVEEVGGRLAAACRTDGGPTRARPISELARRLFGAAGPDELEGLRGMLVVRGAGDLYSGWFPGMDSPSAPLFRLHTFFRSVEGLFATADGADGVLPSFAAPDRPVGRLDVERDVREEVGATTVRRRLELLYCECCGDLFFGGRRSPPQAEEPELVPTDPDIQGLPDSASSQLFENLSYHQFAVFWPSSGREPVRESPFGRWKTAGLDPETGQIRTGAAGKGLGYVPGRLFHRPARREPRHKRGNDSPGTAVSFECPACGTDYFQRQSRGSRLSPLRSFRTGFAKTTQLLASEMFSLLRLTGGEGQKLVSFSDSRQDAARAALDIERRHHEDVRRELLVTLLRGERLRRPSADVLRRRMEDLEQRLAEAFAAKNWPAVTSLSQERDRAEALLKEADEPTLRLSDVAETLPTSRFHGRRDGREPLKPLMREFVTLGIHPSDPVGTRRFRLGGEDDHDAQFVQWHRLFTLPPDQDVDWLDAERDDVQPDSVAAT